MPPVIVRGRPIRGPIPFEVWLGLPGSRIRRTPVSRCARALASAFSRAAAPSGAGLARARWAWASTRLGDQDGVVEQGLCILDTFEGEAAVDDEDLSDVAAR